MTICYLLTVLDFPYIFYIFYLIAYTFTHETTVKNCTHAGFLVCSQLASFDPRARPIVTAGGDNCFCTCRPSVRPFPLFKTKQISSESNVPYCESGRVDP